MVRYYVNKDYDPRVLTGMVTVSQTDSATLVSTIEEMLSGHNLSIKDIRGQGYDKLVQRGMLSLCKLKKNCTLKEWSP